MEMYLYVPLDGDRPWQSDVQPDEEQNSLIEKEELHVFRLDSESDRFEYVNLNLDWDDIPFQRK